MAEDAQQSGTPACFSATHWSIVLSARQHSPEALEKLCARYWYPLYAYVRRSGHSKEEAEDLVQGFFADLLSRDFLKNVGPEKGRFRYFLLACYKNYAANVHERASARKRGGGVAFVRIDAEDPETRYKIEPVDHLTPEKLYERRWALTLIEKALGELAAEYQGREAMFQVLQQFLLQESEASFREAAAQLGTSEGALKVAVHRLRKSFAERLRQDIAQTVSSPQEAGRELDELLAAVS